jgi:hypothetical protein
LRAARDRCDDDGVRLSRVLAAGGPALLLACATARTPSTPRETPLAARVEASGVLFDVLYMPADALELPRIEKGLLAAGARVSRWGAFREGVFVHVLPDHAALETAVERRGYPWLRAWAFADDVLLQSPRSWNGASPADDGDVAELLAHEMTHALMYQLMKPDDDPAWAPEEPPLWFREGMASVTAGQERRRLSRDELSRWLDEHPKDDPLRPSAELYRTEQHAVYSAAHRAFELLLAVSGDGAVRDMLSRVRAGVAFPEAFKSATGRALLDFERDAIQRRFQPLATAGASGSP